MSSEVGTPVEPYRGATDAAIAAWWQGRPLRVPGWGLPDYFISAGVWLVVSVFTAVPLAIFASGSEPYAWSLTLSVVLPFLGLAGYPWLISRLRGNGMTLDFGLRATRTDLLWGVAFGVAALTAAGVVGWLTTVVFGEFDSSAGQLAKDLKGHPGALLVFALAVGLGAPIAEEICYRGLLLGGLLKRGQSKQVAVVVSAVLFAAVHLEPVRFPLLLAIGLLLGWARVWRNNTATSIVAHACNNIPGAISILLMVYS